MYFLLKVQEVCRTPEVGVLKQSKDSKKKKDTRSGPGGRRG
jgi:hypothetical protein